MAHLSGADAGTAGYVGLAWIGLRIVHGCLYLANVDGVRTLVFFGALGCVGWLFALAARA